MLLRRREMLFNRNMYIVPIGGGWTSNSNSSSTTQFTYTALCDGEFYCSHGAYADVTYINVNSATIQDYKSYASAYSMMKSGHQIVTKGAVLKSYIYGTSDTLASDIGCFISRHKFTNGVKGRILFFRTGGTKVAPYNGRLYILTINTGSNINININGTNKASTLSTKGNIYPSRVWNYSVNAGDSINIPSVNDYTLGFILKS